MDASTKSPVDKLLRGISTGATVTIRDAWKELLDHGPHYVPEIRSQLDSDIWRNAPTGPSGPYLGVLLSILAELDTKAFKAEIERLKKSKLHPLHRRTVQLLAQKTADKPAMYLQNGAPVFIANDLEERALIIRCIRKWCKTEGISIEGITRIDVIAFHSQLDYLGAYSPRFSRIVLTWEADRSWGLNRWLKCFLAERTFYHEVGHHVCGHIEGGQDPEQEKEANQYAAKMLKQAHPRVMAVFKYLLQAYRRFRRKPTGNSAITDSEPM